MIPWESATTHVMAHAIHYGSSVFEGVRAYDTPDQGTCIFRLEEHTRRLFDSAKIYRMTIPYSQAEISQATKDVVRLNGLRSAYIRPIAFYGDIGMGLQVPFGTETEVTIAAFLGEHTLVMKHL